MAGGVNAAQKLLGRAARHGDIASAKRAVKGGANVDLAQYTVPGWAGLYTAAAVCVRARRPLLLRWLVAVAGAHPDKGSSAENARRCFFATTTGNAMWCANGMEACPLCCRFAPA